MNTFARSIINKKKSFIKLAPDVMGLRDGGLVRLQHNLGAVVVNVERAEDENETRERRVRWNRAKPVVVDVEQDHLRLGGLQDEVAEFLDLEAGLERQLKFRTLNNDVGEVEKMDLKWIQHALSGDDDLRQEQNTWY